MWATGHDYRDMYTFCSEAGIIAENSSLSSSTDKCTAAKVRILVFSQDRVRFAVAGREGGVRAFEKLEL